MGRQTTIVGSGSCVGPGLHTGRRIRLTLRPAPADTGVVFRRVDLAPEIADIPVSADAVSDTRFSTTLTNAHGVSVSTVEHLLAAVAGLFIDNAILELDGPEAPAMDGSSLAFAQVIADAGVRTLPARRRVLEVIKPVSVSEGASHARFEPSDGFDIDVAIAFDDDTIGRQRAAFTLTPQTFIDMIAPARTFAFLRDVEGLRAAGLAQGGSMENCLVLDGGRVLNEGGLRFADEFVRHKALDALGDLFVGGRFIKGRFVAERPGHRINNLALRALYADPSAWRLRPLADEADDLAPAPAAMTACL